MLAQFAIPNVPTSLPGVSPAPAPKPAPDPIPAPAPAPAPVPADDVLAQFAIPNVPTSLPGVTPASVPSLDPIPAPAPAPAPVPADDVLAQFAIPNVPASNASIPPAMPEREPELSPAAGNDVLAQFAIPNVPTSLPGQHPAANAEDLLAQFSAPAPHSAPTVNIQKPAAPSATDDILAQFSVHPKPDTSLDNLADSLFTAPAAPAQPDIIPTDGLPSVEGEIDTLKTQAASAFSKDDIVEVTPVPASNDYDPFRKPEPQPVVPEANPLDDLLLMPSDSNQPSNIPDIPAVPPMPDLTTVPSAPSAPAPAPRISVPTAAPAPAPIPEPAAPVLNIPQAPAAPAVPPVPAAAQPIPQQPVYANPAMPQGYAIPPQAAPIYPQAPVYGQGYPAGYMPNTPVYPYGQPNPFAVPAAPAKHEPDTKPPLFVGYSADGRQVFQTYDALGNPIPINEPVYSTPPERADSRNTAAIQAAVINHAAAAGSAPVMDMDELMASMGIEDPTKKKVDEGKAINFTEYKIPDKKKKKKTPARPASAQPTEQPSGPISAAEAKRRKKVDKINKEFEKQLRARGIDPKTGGIMIDSKK